MNSTLTSGQRRKLKAMAQRLDTTLKVGKAGLSDSFVESVNAALESLELIKVKFADLKDQKKELAPALAERTGSHLVTLIGHVAVLFRAQADPEKRKIKLGVKS